MLSDKELIKNAIKSMLDFIDTLDEKPEEFTYYPNNEQLDMSWDDGITTEVVAFALYDDDTAVWSWERYTSDGDPTNGCGVSANVAEAYKALMDCKKGV